MPPEGSNTEVLVAIAKLDGKLDLALAETAALKNTDADHELRIRTVEARPVPDEETDKRIKVLEERRTVSPAQLWTGLVGVLGLVVLVMTIAEKWPSVFGG